MDVFISWTSADRDVKNAVVDKLQDAGITCWDSDENCTSDFSEECIAAIKRCGVFISIISNASMHTKYVRNEVITARDMEHEGKLNILVYKITDEPYTNEFEFLLNHISFVTGNMIQRKSSVSGESGIDIIVKRTQTLLRKRKEGNPEKPFDVHVPEINGLKITRTGYFVDGSRDTVLAAMDKAFQDSNVLILTEFFGYGKRSTIKKYVECHRNEYTAAVMVHNEYSNLREFFLTGLDFVNINEKTFDELQGEALLRAKIKLLEKLDEKTLLVIPDVKFESQPDTALCEMLAGLKCRIILLTQDTADAYADWFPVIQVGRMQDAHLYELFFHHYVRAYEEEKEALTEPLAQFFANIGGHTKTVELTAATLNRDLGVPPEEVPGYLSMQGSEGVQLKDRIIRQIESIFDVEKLSQDEITALLAAACVAVPYVSEKSFRTVLKNCGVQDLHVVAELDKRRWLDLDIQNRIVSIEPLVAQIVLSKFPDAYKIITICLNYLIDSTGRIFSITISEASSVQTLRKLEYFFTITGLPECAQIASQCCRSIIEDSAYDSRNMTEAIRRFEEKYPASKPSMNASLDQEEFEEVPSEETGEIYNWFTYEDAALSFIRQLLPVSKFISYDAKGLFWDFSSEGNRIMMSSQITMSDSSNMEELFGITKEESLAVLEMFRQEAQDRSQLDDDSFEAFILMECTAVMDSIYTRDYRSILASIQSLFDQISRAPEILTNEGYSDMVFAVFQALGKIYLSSRAYSSAIMLCEKLLAYPSPPLKKLMILQIYVAALRRSSLYTETLYAAYKEMLGEYDKAVREVFEMRADLLREKKGILLMYAADLARGEKLDDAQIQFAAAWRLGDCLLPDDTADCAQCIADIFIKSGYFNRAVAFIDTYFTTDVMAEYLKIGSEKTQKIMSGFAAYQSAGHITENEFSANTDPRKYVSYYHAFSRKNNKLLEQKYLSVADRAMDYDFSDLTTEEIAEHANELRRRARKEKMLRLAPEAFALASEAGFRVLGYRHHYVQYMGAAAMADGKIAEILNGEGKTYTIVLTAFLHSLYGKQVFVVDQSPNLTSRNYNWMRGVYDLLGVRNLCINEGADIAGAGHGVIYISLKTLLIGFLRYECNLDARRSDLLLDSVIVDEIDTTLVDGADAQYAIVTGQRDHSILLLYRRAWEIAGDVVNNEEYYTYSEDKVLLKPAIYPLLERKFHISYADIGSLEKTQQIERIVSAAILCCGHFEKDRDYFIFNGVPVMENKEKGVFERFSPMYGYFLCRDNDLDMQQVEKDLTVKNRTRNTIGIRDFFKKFHFVCGTTATAVSFREEFREIYDLNYISVPPHSPCIRQDFQSPVYITQREKDRAILELVKEKVDIAQPILMITQSVEESEKYSRLLRRNGITHKLLNAKNAQDFSDMIAWAGVSGSVLVTNALAGRGADIKLGGSPELRTRRELVEMGEDVTALDSFVYSLPTQKQRETELYRKYYSILEKNRLLCAADRQTVVDAGGLCVIGTSFFPEPRTEQQTRGRSGRQGEVGESWIFRSIEDEGLKSLLSSAMLDWLLSTFDDVEELDAPALYKAMKTAQQNIHHARFASIRKQNSNARYFDKARKDFIGKRFDLTEGVLSIDDLLQEWASDKTVLQELQVLQKGEMSCGIPILTRLWRKYAQLETAKGGKAAAVLYGVLKTELAQIFKNVDYTSSTGVTLCICKFIFDSWEEYIAIVQDTVGKVAMKEQSLERYLEEEKKRLLRKPVEQLLMVRLKQKKS